MASTPVTGISFMFLTFIRNTLQIKQAPNITKVVDLSSRDIERGAKSHDAYLKRLFPPVQPTEAIENSLELYRGRATLNGAGGILAMLRSHEGII
jgi:hypothetical protein